MSAVIDLFHEIDKRLCNAYHLSTTKQLRNLSPSLVFPMNRSEKIRVSEQEARIMMAITLNEMAIPFAIETPTRKLYQQSGTGSRSAQTDLTLLKRDGSSKLNIELKSGGFTPKRPDKLSIAKDIEKLLYEDTPAAWYHVLESTNNSTLGNLWRVFIEGSKKVRQSKDIEPDKTILYHLVVLKHEFSLTIKLKSIREADVSDAPIYKVSRDKLISFDGPSDWQLWRHE